MNFDLTLLNGYSEATIESVKTLINSNRLGIYLEKKYSDSHEINSDSLLYDYVNSIKKTFMKRASPVHKAGYCDRVEQVYGALGLNKSVSKIQGRRVKSKNEIVISSIFKNISIEFLNMIVVHELAHLKVKEHNREFYSLCQHMNSEYFQLEFDFRLLLINKKFS